MWYICVKEGHILKVKFKKKKHLNIFNHELFSYILQ